jgi:CheY-like chemotaxis protein
MARRRKAERVLIIDDDILSREVLTLLLEGAEHEVWAVSSGEAALTHLTSTDTPPPTVVLTDVQLPGIAGIALGSALRRACPPDSVLLAMSGSDPAAELLTAFDAFLLKPFYPAEFSAVLRHCRSSARPSPNGAIDSHKGGTTHTAAPASNLNMSAHIYQGQPSAPSIPAPLSPASDPSLDESIFSQLKDTMSGTQLRQMYDLCLDDVRKRIATMRDHAAAKDSESFIRQAHAIKGGCGMLGASELYRMASVLEKAGLKAAGLRDGTGVNPLDELAAACDRLERILITRT